MKKLKVLLTLTAIIFALNGCALTEFLNDGKNVVDLGEGDVPVRWTLVENDNEYRSMESAYFEFGKDNFRYFENGELKKEGGHRITYMGEDDPAPLHLNLTFGKVNGISAFDYIDCFTEDKKDDLRQFTIIREGYHVKAERVGGVPVRDYHLSEMPYAFGTYVREGKERYSYTTEKCKYRNVDRLNGTFADEKGNKFYFTSNSYAKNTAVDKYIHYFVYMRYENAERGDFVEGTIYLSEYNEFDSGKHHNVAMIYVLHGDGEPAKEKGVSVEADYELMDFDFIGETAFSITGGKYFYDNTECEYDPSGFVAGVYMSAAG